MLCQSEKAEGAKKLTIKLPPQSGKENGTVNSAEEENDNYERQTLCPSDLKKDILGMVERHYCAHPLIPGYLSPT